MSSIPTELPKAYEPEAVEKRWYDFWLENECFHAEETSEKPSYCIVIPPPNVTGSLHMGHALDNTLQDILIRWKRMSGFNTLWMPGTDHAGIITEVVMERMLAQEGVSRLELGRAAFLERMWAWKDASRGTIIGQLKRLGCSCDWDRERFTLDEGSARAVRRAFKTLYDAGLIVRGDQMVNWVPSLQSGVSDLEVEYEERVGKLYYVRYPVLGSDVALVVATTRPETMLGDTGVAVHPEDSRYGALIGRTAILPLVGREIPIIGDAYVDREFGTGALKVTPGSDPNDYEIGKRHGLGALTILNPDGTMSEACGVYAGLDRFECRQRVVSDLDAQGYLVKIEEYTHTVGVHERTKEVVEPVVARGWFLRMKPLAERAIQAVHEKRLRFIPENQTAVFLNWMENVRDWNLSRQRWWGHPVPAWYAPDGTVFVAESEADARAQARERFGAEVELTPDADVLDTWFSSGLWPLSTLGWPDTESPTFKTFFPTDVLVTGWDILFFWVSRMVNFALRLADEVPFHTVYLHPLLAGDDGKKMSKSKGNVVDPIALMDAYGTDAFRFAVAAAMIEAPWMQLPEGRIAGYRNFANKIWNAARFVLMHLRDFSPDAVGEWRLELADRWIRSRYTRVVEHVVASLERFRFGEASNALYDFIWKEFCDWYIEFAKVRLYGAFDPVAKNTVKYVLWETMDGWLRLLHPFMPFITEEVWQHLPHEGSSLCRAAFPTPDLSRVDDAAEREVALIMDVTTAIRRVRGEMNIAPSTEIRLLTHTPNAWERDVLTSNMALMVPLVKASGWSIALRHEKPKASAVAVAGGVETFIPLEGVIDIEQEVVRLRKEFAKAEKDLTRVRSNLANPNFVNRARPEVVAQERERQTELEATRAALERNLRLLTE
jgi:valyl-tRNA synthetase